MRHPYQKFIQMEVIGLVLSFLSGITALITGWVILLFFAVYLLVLSIVCDAIILMQTRRQSEAMKQAIRAFVLFLLITSMFFQL
ncbi:hypothetical protein M3E13_02355 [Oceanobacillus kimchii]|uniref:Uncharacterized protein n=1 Tax=Oceanobacillus kimchii TaxID=746691 RepID=A0ABQ5TNH4_9BACI|nr:MULTISPECIES: hypothetical protein [Oceanobacillus]MBT2599490.1 hypothetical protein [Oceanobacillus sp. ISL-74]MCT1576676.1 hypothetical protein [Oceanobacillus kimchii]MCT2134746.1 hypothetical protein [Oceanobacillus kimchii]OEH56045.1 hypothetical protein AQ616_00570 [Oceanobacillus sp. E9]GLO67712.1 hypothetical protein MACH08_34960 [Oceanobacillus kimchii]